MKPVIILAFANDKDDYLPMINRERKNIFKTLQDHHDRGCIQMHKEETTSIEDIFDLFNRYGEQVAIFHYGGHAGGTHLQLETDGDAQMADAFGLAQLLGQQKELQLVFLNGCATKKQVELLLEAGVRAVIATSVPINDKMAVEFSEQFYNTLANQAAIGKAFDTAKAFVTTKYGRAKEIGLYRDINWKGKKQVEKEEMPWGLYVNEKSPEAQDWTLPAASRDSIIIRGSAAAYGQDAQVNAQLLETLINAVAQHSFEVGYLLEAYKKSRRLDVRMVRQAIIDSFPAPLGEQLRRLFAGNIINVERLRRLTDTYNRAVELLCFSMLSQLWEVKYTNPQMVMSDDFMVEFNSFFALNAGNYRAFNYVKLIEAISGVLQENKIEYFVMELDALEKLAVDKESEFYKAYLFMEEMKNEILENKIKADEIESFCLQAENHLSAILSQLAFFAKYKLATIKRIEIIKERHKEPQYRHNRVLLDKITAGVLDEVETYDDFADNNSVILLKNIEEIADYLSLSPFVFDENALLGSQNSKLFFFCFQDAQNGDCYYKFVDNEEEQLIVSDTTYPQVKKQIEE
ncbi:MAG: CHAT domain-containing protein, partial [Candidatus Aminicenantes bacterium]|nr:CHAT domain-containing protein [Candidatus Aminicenantes bacterium]